MTLKAQLDELLAGAVAAGDVPFVTAAVVTADGATYTGAFGAVGGADVQPDSVAAIHSMTKAVTGIAAMQLVERGELHLDAPAGEVCPFLGDVRVLEGYDESGAPRLRAPSQPVTLRRLLTHTSGFVYEMWNEVFADYLARTDTPSLMGLQKASLKVPLMFDPGARWEYGIGIDWVGMMVEAASGQTLGEYMREHIFEPLGMSDTAFTATASMAARRLPLFHRDADGSLAGGEIPPAPEAPEFEMGGGGLLSTVLDYGRLLSALLNGGRAGEATLLAPETIAEMGRNHIGDLRVTLLRSCAPALSNDAELFPGQPKTWGLTFQVSETACDTGRPAGTLMWAGLGNSYYWLDLKQGIAGAMLTQVFPFADPRCVQTFYDLERMTYATL